MLATAPDGHGEYVPCSTTPGSDGCPATDSTGSKSAYSTAQTDGAKGCTLTVGRFTLTLPPGSFSGPGTITMAMRDTTVLVCELGISPSTANQFKYPAELTADLSGMSVSQDSVAMYWYDPAMARWAHVSAQTKGAGTSVTAYLGHFSRYGLGKTGW